MNRDACSLNPDVLTNYASIIWFHFAQCRIAGQKTSVCGWVLRFGGLVGTANTLYAPNYTANLLLMTLMATSINGMDLAEPK